MDLSPASLTQSPLTPSDCSSPGLVKKQYKLSPIYIAKPPCSMPPGLEPEFETSLPMQDSKGQSPDWNSTNALHPLSSAEYVPYSGYNSPHGHDILHSRSPHGTPMATATPPPSRWVTRSPVPSMSRTSLSYTPATSATGSLPRTPRLKMEMPPKDGRTIEFSHYPSPRSMQAVPTSYTADKKDYSSTAYGCMSDTSSIGWRKSDRPSAENDHFLSGATSQPVLLHDTQCAQRIQRPRRAPRRLTTKEEANFQCEVKGCGKLFSRSYNYKAHMETHDEKREYPFPCLIVNCNKKFVRKTDLQRHHSSVHARERSYRCDYCARMFARKDTLRRHMEDGCSKRFDVGTLNLWADTYHGFDADGRNIAASMSRLVTPPGVLSPLAKPPLGSGGIPTYTVYSCRGGDLSERLSLQR